MMRHGAVARPGPVRRLALGTLISAVGNGAWYTSWALFLTRSVGLTPGQLGLGMTAAAALGVLAATPFGWLGDRMGARELFAVQLALEGVAGCGYLVVHGMVSFLLVTTVAQVASSGSGGPRNALLLSLSEGADRFELLSLLRAISHAGWAVGAVLGGVVLALDSRPAYLVVVALNGLTYLVYSGLVASVPRVAGAGADGARADRAAPGGRRLGVRVLHDRPYLSLAGLMGILALCWAMLSSGLPLWVALHTHAPHAISAVVVVISCVGIAGFQVRVSRGFTDPRRAARGALSSGVALAGACLLLALTNGAGGVGAIVLILVAACLHVTGELLFVASSWGLSVPLMPADAPSEYQGAFATGEALSLMVAPVLMTTLVAGWGQPGWFVLAAIFLVPGVAAMPAARWALRTRVVEAA